MREEIAIKILKQTKETLDKHGIEFWLNCGTLLGAVRSGKFINHDDDIDLSAWQHKITEQQVRSACRELSQQGFNVYYTMLTNYIAISIKKYNIPVGFSTYVLEGDKAVHIYEYLFGTGIDTLIARQIYWLSEIFARKRVGKINIETICGLRRIAIFFGVTLTNIFPENIKKRLAAFFRLKAAKIGGEFGREQLPVHYFLKLRDLTFYGEKFKVPNNPEEYLEFLYGPDWKVPRKNWKFYLSDGKLVCGLEHVNKVWNYK